jgi:hypothetical protein
MTEQVPLPLIRDDVGGMYARAGDVSALLRGVGDAWLGWVDQGLTDLESETVEALAASLHEVADQLDVECIAVRTAAAHNPTPLEATG